MYWLFPLIALAGSPDGPAAQRIAALDAEVARLRAAWTEPPDPRDPAWVARRLAHLVEIDQVLRRAVPPPAGWPESERQALLDAVSERIRAADQRHTAEVKELVERHGWFEVSVFGREASHHAWLLVQHADADPAFQQQVLDLMAPLASTGEALGADYAYLFDRVAVSQEQPQRYGTQGRCDPDRGAWVPLPLDDPDTLDARRAELGLPPMAEYAAMFDCTGERAAAIAAYEASDWTTCATAFADYAEPRTGRSAASAWYNAACCAALGGDPDAAFAHLDQAAAAGPVDLEQARSDPDLASLRDDPRWAAWEARVRGE